MADRGYITWKPQEKTKVIVDHILTLIQNGKDAGQPAPTVRDIYYDLIAQYGAPFGYVKGDKFQRKVYGILTKMRRSRMIEFSDINDDSSDTLVTRTFKDEHAFWSDVKGRANTYKMDLTTNQPYRVLIFTEGAGMVRQFYTVAKNYTIPVYSPGGRDSISLKHDTAVAATAEYIKTERQTVILHTGDFDPDGAALFDVFVEDVKAFISNFNYDPEEVIRFDRAMITVEHTSLLPRASRTVFNREELKEKNYRGHKWPLDFKAELQALPMPRRLALMREAIERVVDLDQLRVDQEQSKEQHRRVLDRADVLVEEAENGKPEEEENSQRPRRG